MISNLTEAYIRNYKCLVKILIRVKQRLKAHRPLNISLIWIYLLSYFIFIIKKKKTLLYAQEIMKTFKKHFWVFHSYLGK